MPLAYVAASPHLSGSALYRAKNRLQVTYAAQSASFCKNREGIIVTGLKVFVGLNALFYLAYGLIGAIHPGVMANTMGWEPSLLGLHEVRAIWLAVAAMGVILFAILRSTNQLEPVVKAIMFVTAAFFVARVLGLAFDGTGPQLTYIEMGLEVIILIWGAITLSTVK